MRNLASIIHNIFTYLFNHRLHSSFTTTNSCLRLKTNTQENLIHRSWTLYSPVLLLIFPKREWCLNSSPHLFFSVICSFFIFSMTLTAYTILFVGLFIDIHVFHKYLLSPSYVWDTLPGTGNTAVKWTGRFDHTITWNLWRQRQYELLEYKTRPGAWVCQADWEPGAAGIAQGFRSLPEACCHDNWLVPGWGKSHWSLPGAWSHQSCLGSLDPQALGLQEPAGRPLGAARLGLVPEWTTL